MIVMIFLLVLYDFMFFTRKRAVIMNDMEGASSLTLAIRNRDAKNQMGFSLSMK